MFLAMYDAVRAYEAEHRPDPHEGQPDPSYVRGQEEMRHRAAEVAGAISVVTHSPYFSSCAELIRNLTVYPR
jgi:hypothetical protein